MLKIIIFMIFFVGNIFISRPENFSDDLVNKQKSVIEPITESPLNNDNKQFESQCLSASNCDSLNYPCISCSFNESCIYGEEAIAKCKALVNCNGKRNFERVHICQYCYQTYEWEHDCVAKANCNSVSSPKSYYRTNCTVKNEIVCLGRRTFVKNLPCNWTGGHRWSTALFLSITLGGFGADRFYLGYWQEGIGKLFSFGGLGVWTIIDFILISIQYLGPADGSLYI